MFLIEGDDRAVLYTGDNRAEPWFVNALARNPLLVEYTSNLKTLDCIYLDTSFTADVVFPTKAEGLKELLQKVSKYPPTTEFHFAAWTFGYEEVWMALSRSLKSQIHVDNYKMRLYQSLLDDSSRAEIPSGSCLAPEAPILAGHRAGNTDYPGILTLDHTVRLHSCEKGIRCSHLGDQTVWIKPIIARTSSGNEICEMGVGGGGDDLNQRPEVELDNDTIIRQLMALFVDQEDSSILSTVRCMLLAGLHSSRQALVLHHTNPDDEEGELSLEELVNILMTSATKQCISGDAIPVEDAYVQLPKVITFPYLRHSSYAELRDLIKAFKPIDVYPCTVNKADWHEGVSMRALFGDLCSGYIFRHDQEMREILPDHNQDETQKSWNISDMNASQTSSEDRDYLDDFSDGEDEMLSEARKPNTVAGSTAALGIIRSPNMYRDECGEPRKSDQLGTTSNIFEADSASLLSTRAQTKWLSSELEVESLHRKANLEEDNGSIRKRARLHGGQTDTKPHALDRLAWQDAEDASQSSISDMPGVAALAKPAYHEFIDSTDNEETNEHADAGARLGKSDRYPRIYYSASAVEDDSGDDIKSQERIDLTGYYLDGVSAYDSASNAEENEYEMNSFIDSCIHVENDEDTECSTSEDIDYKARYEQLSSAYSNLEQKHDHLINDHEELRGDMLRSNYNDSGDLDDLDDSDELQFEAIDIQVQNPPVSESVLSLVQGDSQSSAVSTRRLRTRIDAFLAAHEGWHNISLMSTGDNHTEEELEL